MRIWSLHPKYLDPVGLVALWREGLLAQKVLQGGTRGYRHHPQLTRFREQADPVAAIAAYLRAVQEEAERRGYRFERKKIEPTGEAGPIAVTRGQLLYERQHLLNKLYRRSEEKYRELAGVEEPEPHPLLVVVDGEIEEWERGKSGERRAERDARPRLPA